MTDEQRKELGQCLSDMGKATNNAQKLVAAADSGLPQLSKHEKELMEMNLDKYKAVAQEAEEVTLWKLMIWLADKRFVLTK